MGPKHLKLAVVREEFFALTGNTFEAIILNHFVYWSERMADVDQYIAEESLRMQQEGKETNVALTRGWIYKTAEELIEEAMLSISRQSTNRLLQSLVDRGYLLQRHNPQHRWDRKYQYRVNFLALQNDLEKLGYILQGYAWNALNTAMLTASNALLTESNGMLTQSHAMLTESDGRLTQSNRLLKNEQAIAEITTEKKEEEVIRAHAREQENIPTFIKTTEPASASSTQNALGTRPSQSASALRSVTRIRATRRRRASDAPALDKPSALAVSQAQDTAHAEVVTASDAREDFAERVEDIAIRLLGRDLLHGDEMQLIAQLLSDGVPHTTILRGIQESFDAFKPRYTGDRIKSLTYCEGRIRELHEMLTRPAPVAKGGYGPGKSRSRYAGRTIGERQDEKGQWQRTGTPPGYSAIQPGKYDAFWNQFTQARPEGGRPREPS